MQIIKFNQMQIIGMCYGWTIIQLWVIGIFRENKGLFLAGFSSSTDWVKHKINVVQNLAKQCS
jgi:hypothetical protein